MIDAAILIPVYRCNDGELHIVMVLRNPGGVHGGQIAFPGGKRDSEDATMLDTALREVREELGVIVTKNDVIAELPWCKPERRVIECFLILRASPSPTNGKSPSARSLQYSM
jgi:8-oxo-dGTP pyrophosphatase MutT (NUDIX family)